MQEWGKDGITEQDRKRNKIIAEEVHRERNLTDGTQRKDVENDNPKKSKREREEEEKEEENPKIERKEKRSC